VSLSGHDNSELVPKHLLELCKDTLKHCLASRFELEARIRELEAEVLRLRGG